MPRTFILVLVLILILVLSFMIYNTMIGGILISEFDKVAASSEILNDTLDYPTKAAYFTNVMYTAMYIIVAIPFAFILIWILKREPATEERF